MTLTTTLDDLKSSHAMYHSFMKLLLSHNNNRFKHLLKFQQYCTNEMYIFISINVT